MGVQASSRVQLLLFALFLVAVGCSGGSRSAPPAGEGEEGGAAPKTDPAPSVSPETPVAAPTQPPSADKYGGLGTMRPRVAQTIIALTNRERRAQGRPPLHRDSTLARIACWHNQDMLAHAYMGHEDTEGQLPNDRMMREHRRLIGSVGENVFESSAVPKADPESADAWARDAFGSWMNSSGHRANILRPQFTHVGVCVTHAGSGARATQMFAGVWAYLDTPLPWSLAPDDSLSVSFTPVKASGPPAEYAFVSVGESVEEAFSEKGRGRSFRDTLYLPKEAGVYGSLFLFPEGDGHYRILSGPRVRVE